jgi:hypothetical protein
VLRARQRIGPNENCEIILLIARIANRAGDGYCFPEMRVKRNALGFYASFSRLVPAIERRIVAP